MDRNCDAFIRSNNTYDILIARESLEISDDRAECIQNIGEKFVAEYFDRDEVPQLSIKTYGYSIIPKCFGLLDTLALETTGILQLQNQPALSLRGQGIFIGFVDTGISYELPCFRNADGSTRIRSIWDQSIPAGEKNTPQGFLYGTEYTQKEINEALEQEHPRELVPVTDEDGHGTMLASIACGSEDLQAGFTGAAPYAELLVVKLKPAKPYLKDFFYIPQEMPAYQENDIMAAVEYLEETARKLGRPLILCLGLGTNNGSHSGGSNLSELLDDIAGRWRRCAVVATGNEANARHHFYGKSDGNSMVVVEVNVEQRMRGFYLELWASAPELFVVAVRSPGGTLMPAQNVPGNSHQEQEFIFEGTRVEIDYAQVGRTRGDQLVFIRFENPAAGIWTLYVNPSTTITGQFHIWLPMSGMLEKDVVFLRPDPDVTLTVPSSAKIPIGVGGMDQKSGILYLDSGRGNTIASVVKPDFVAPAVGVQAIGRLGNYVTLTGTSAASAIAAGACAQIMEWGNSRGRRLLLNSVQIGNILIRGCERNPDVSYPNTTWGYGKMNVYDALMKFYGV